MTSKATIEIIIPFYLLYSMDYKRSEGLPAGLFRFRVWITERDPYKNHCISTKPVHDHDLL
jgi:hypothetical protein